MIPLRTFEIKTQKHSYLVFLSKFHCILSIRVQVARKSDFMSVSSTSHFVGLPLAAHHRENPIIGIKFIDNDFFPLKLRSFCK